MKKVHYLEKEFDVPAVIERKWYFTEQDAQDSIRLSYMSNVFSIMTSTVIPGYESSYCKLDGIATCGSFDTRRSLKYVNPDSTENLAVPILFSRETTINHHGFIPQSSSYSDLSDYKTIETEGDVESSIQFMVLENDDYIDIMVFKRGLTVTRQFKTLWGPSVETNYSELPEEWKDYNVYTKRKRGNMYFVKKVGLLESEKVLGNTMYSPKTFINIWKGMNRVRYNKNKHTWSASVLSNNKCKAHFSTNQIVDNLQKIHSRSAKNMFFDLVLQHLNSTLGTNESMPHKLDIHDKISWFRRFKRNIHRHNSALVSKLDLKYVNYPILKIMSKLNVPKRFVDDFAGGQLYYDLVISSFIGRSFNTNGGVLNTTYKSSVDLFNMTYIVFKYIGSIIAPYPGSVENFINYRDMRSIDNNYILYLSQKNIKSAYEILKPFLDYSNNHEKLFKSGKPDLYSQVYNLINTIFDNARDSQMMLNNILNAGYGDLIEPHKTLREFHDHLSLINNRIKKENTLVPSHDKYIMETDSYIIKKPMMTHDIVRVGEYMNICVGGYTQRVMQGDCEIVVVYSKDTMNPIVCIEVKQKRILQAKLNRNSRVNSDSNLNKLVCNWAEKMKLQISTSDIN